MKKENKELAKQRRAAERKKQEQKDLLKKICAIVIPILLIVVFVIAVAIESGTLKIGFDSGNSSAASESSSTVSSGDASKEELPYLTDTSLTVANGDTVNIDYVGYVDGVAFDGGNTQGNGADLTIGSGRYIDDFEEQLIGYHPGDTVEVNVTFPEDYGNEELNGKDALFEVVINGIYE